MTTARRLKEACRICDDFAATPLRRMAGQIVLEAGGERQQATEAGGGRLPSGHRCKEEEVEDVEY